MRKGQNLLIKCRFVFFVSFSSWHWCWRWVHSGHLNIGTCYIIWAGKHGGVWTSKAWRELGHHHISAASYFYRLCGGISLLLPCFSFFDGWWWSRQKRRRLWQGQRGRTTQPPQQEPADGGWIFSWIWLSVITTCKNFYACFGQKLQRSFIPTTYLSPTAGGPASTIYFFCFQLSHYFSFYLTNVSPLLTLRNI